MNPQWRTVPMKSEVKLLSGGTPNKSKDRYWGGTIPWVSSGEMTQRRISDTELHVTDEGVANGTKLVPENTVLVVVRGMSLAKEFRVSLTTRPVTFNQDLKALNPSDRVDPGFLFYYLQSQQHAIRDSATDASHGTKKLETRVLESWPLPVPDLEEQYAIRDILSAYDDLIENNRRRIQLLEEAARLLYREWFVHLRFPGHEHVRVVDGVPEGWEREPLSEIADITMGQSPKSIYYNEEGNGLPFHQGVTNFGVRFPSHQTYCTVQNQLAEPGDILFSVRAPVGRINLTTDRIVIGRGLASIRSNRNQQNFLFYALKNRFFKDDLMGGGTIFASITKKELYGVELVQPTGQVAEMFMEHVRPIDLQIENLQQTIDSLAKARDLLLPRLMNGEIAV